MARLVTILILLIVPLLVFNLFGLGGGSTKLLGEFGFLNPDTAVSHFSIMEILSWIAIGATITGITAGAFFGRNLETILYGLGVGAMVGIFTAILIDYIFIYNELSTVNSGLAKLIISPIILVGLVFIIEWIMKKD